MIWTIKRKALELEADPVRLSGVDAVPVAAADPVAAGAPEATSEVARDALYEAILAKTKVLKPTKVTLQAESIEGSPRYVLKIVAPCFEGLVSAKREQLVSTVLRKEKQAAELIVKALTPEEAGV
jgi:stress-induced morphogen